MTTYLVRLHVSSTSLQTLLGIIENAAGIKLLTVSDPQDAEPLPPSPPPPARAPAPTEPAPRIVGGSKRVKGVEVVLETLRSGPATLAELKRAFTHHSFSAASTPQYLSKLLKSKQIERRPNGSYTLASNGRGAAP